MSTGFVSLVGAGPGDPELITLKGAQRLREADVVIYDYLANPLLLEHCRPEAERIYVGKQAGRHTLSQDEINTLLLEHGRERRVVRLKGGDPFIFGRGGEEAEALEAAGIGWEVVPGVTAGIAAPAYAGIPVTHRELASSVALITGHEDPAKPETAVDWPRLAHGVDTLVFYMGVGNLPEIAARLIEHGRAPETPVAVVRWGTMPEQQVVSGTLSTIAGEVERTGLKPPAITVVGEVAALRERLRWFDKGPLWRRRIVVTRAREQASALAEQLRAAGAVPIEYPAIAFAPPADLAPLDAALDELGSYNWIVFTSANGVRFVAQRLSQLGRDTAELRHASLAAIGPATAAELERHGLRSTFTPTEFVAEAVVEQIGEVQGQRILLPRADIAREALADGLRARGARVDNVVAYRTVLAVETNQQTSKPANREPRTRDQGSGTDGCRQVGGLGVSPSIRSTDSSAPAARPDDLDDPVVAQLRQGSIDAMTFTSSSTVSNFFARLEQSGVARDEALRLLEPVVVASIGPITSATAREHGLDITVEAERYTIDGLMEALVSVWSDGETGRL